MRTGWLGLRRAGMGRPPSGMSLSFLALLQTAPEPLKLRALANLIELLRADEETMSAAQQDTSAAADGGLPTVAGGARKKGGRKKGGAAAAEEAAADAERSVAVPTQNGMSDTLSQSSSILQVGRGGRTGGSGRRGQGCPALRASRSLLPFPTNNKQTAPAGQLGRRAGACHRHHAAAPWRARRLAARQRRRRGAGAGHARAAAGGGAHGDCSEVGAAWIGRG